MLSIIKWYAEFEIANLTDFAINGFNVQQWLLQLFLF